MKILQLLPSAFPWIVLSASFLALVHPPIFTWFSGNLITLGLGGIMLGMGLALELKDFKQVTKTPSWILTGFLLQFTLMPFFGWLLGILFELPPFFCGRIDIGVLLSGRYSFKCNSFSLPFEFGTFC